AGLATVTAVANSVPGSHNVEASVDTATAFFNLTNAGPIVPHYLVNTTSNAIYAGPGLMSLRLAVALADTDGVASTITFDPTVFAQNQTITLSGSPLELSDPSGMETITGPAAGVTINGGGRSGVFQVDAGVSAALSKLT